MILTFDRPDYLEECLASVARQTLTGFRLVVLDNASKADLSGLLNRFQELPISYVRNETNIGAAGNFRKAIRCYSDSKYLIVFHDDDMMHPRMLEWQLGLLESDPEIQFVSTELVAFDDGDTQPQAIWENSSLDIEVYNNPSELARYLLGTGGLCFGSTMYRSSVLKRIRPDDYVRFGIIGDRPFLLDAARRGKSALIRAPLVLYRHHPGQDTKKAALTAQNLIELTKAYREALPSDWGRADQELFYAHSRYFLTQYGYARLTKEERIGAITFVRKCIWNRVLRFRDVRHGVLEELMRVDGRRTLPFAIEAARGARRRLLPRRPRTAGDQNPPVTERGQARHPED